MSAVHNHPSLHRQVVLLGIFPEGHLSCQPLNLSDYIPTTAFLCLSCTLSKWRSLFQFVKESTIRTVRTTVLIIMCSLSFRSTLSSINKTSYAPCFDNRSHKFLLCSKTTLILETKLSAIHFCVNTMYC